MICQNHGGRQSYFERGRASGSPPPAPLWPDPRRHGTLVVRTHPGRTRAEAPAGGEGKLRIVTFHRILIGTAVLCAAGFAVWQYLDYRRTGDPGALWIAAAALCLSGLLAYYLRHLKRFLTLS